MKPETEKVASVYECSAPVSQKWNPKLKKWRQFLSAARAEVSGARQFFKSETQNQQSGVSF
ncbi:MAG: hypothetical protein HZC54_22240 [Verrucomicrobia bacterium]|nr:hypothetical protein [Verrucomicrobiota bacterium]